MILAASQIVAVNIFDPGYRVKDVDTMILTAKRMQQKTSDINMNRADSE